MIQKCPAKKLFSEKIKRSMRRQLKRLDRFKFRIGLLLAKAALTRATERLCVGSIPRSGDDARHVNCRRVHILENREPCFLVLACQGLVIKGKAWDKAAQQYSGDSKMSIARLKGRRIQFVHYWGIHDIIINGIIDYYLKRLTMFPYGFALFGEVVSFVRKKLFQLKTLEEADRDKLLEYVIAQYAFNRTRFHMHDLLTKKYSIYWASHPDVDSIKLKTEYILDSLCNTGELSKDPYQQYIVEPLAISTLAKTRQANLRHYQLLLVQWLSIAIGFSVMLTAIIEAGIVQAPCLLGFDRGVLKSNEKKCLLDL